MDAEEVVVRAVRRCSVLEASASVPLRVAERSAVLMAAVALAVSASRLTNV